MRSRNVRLYRIISRRNDAILLGVAVYFSRASLNNDNKKEIRWANTLLTSVGSLGIARNSKVSN